MTKKPLSDKEKAYIEEYCLQKTDEELGEDLKRDPRTIKTYRTKIGVIKKQGGKIAKLTTNDAILSAKSSGRYLVESERKEFFQTQLTNSLFYENLKLQFTEDEIDFYLEEWGALCVQFEDIVATEKRQIDELIKAEIMGNRILRNVKIAEDEILMVQGEIDQLRKDYNKSFVVTVRSNVKRISEERRYAK